MGPSPQATMEGPRITHKQLGTPGCAQSTVGTNALALKHQVISTHSDDSIHCIVPVLHKNLFIVNNIGQQNQTSKNDPVV